MKLDCLLLQILNLPLKILEGVCTLCSACLCTLLGVLTPADFGLSAETYHRRFRFAETVVHELKRLYRANLGLLFRLIAAHVLRQTHNLAFKVRHKLSLQVQLGLARAQFHLLLVQLGSEPVYC